MKIAAIKTYVLSADLKTPFAYSQGVVRSAWRLPGRDRRRGRHGGWGEASARRG